MVKYQDMDKEGGNAGKVRQVLGILRKAIPGAACALKFGNPLELLVATILSAQCTDERVNRVTPRLFLRYRTARDYEEASLGELEELVRPTGFFRNKAANIRKCCARIAGGFGGVVPESMEELKSLPGVGRKTASVVLGTAFGKAEGIVVDTHVARLSKRLGLTGAEDPEQIEKDLMRIVPRESWIEFSHLLIHHGRLTCGARKPGCEICVVRDLCPAAGKA